MTPVPWRSLQVSDSPRRWVAARGCRTCALTRRAKVERARALVERGEANLAAEEIARLQDELTPRKALQMEGYWKRDLVPPLQAKPGM